MNQRDRWYTWHQARRQTSTCGSSKANKYAKETLQTSGIQVSDFAVLHLRVWDSAGNGTGECRCLSHSRKGCKFNSWNAVVAGAGEHRQRAESAREDIRNDGQ